MARFEIPRGWTAQGYQFALDPTPAQAQALDSHAGRCPVPPHPLPRLPQHVTPVDPVRQGVETPILLLLGRSP